MFVLQLSAGSGKPLGVSVLKARGIFVEGRWYWIGAAALFGYILLFNILYTLALTFLERKFQNDSSFGLFSNGKPVWQL